MDDEPPDPGGTVPPVGVNVTIAADSSMDTDCSVRSERRKRTRIARRICKHCNKKRRQHKQAADGKIGCNCDSDSNEQNVSIVESETAASSAATPSPNTIAPAPLSTSSAQQPLAQIGRSKYESSDVAPYVVHIQKSGDTPTIHPVSFGQYLKKKDVKGIINGSVKRLGRNKLCISFSDYNDANIFIADPELASKQLQAFIPSFNITRMGVVRGVPTEWTPEEVQANISVPIGCGKVLKARRFNYKVHGPTPEWKPSQTVVLTFDGQVLPKRVFLCYNSLPVELYSFPTIQCFNCCRFGHTKAKCNSKPRCYRCGQEHSGDSCNIESDNASCIYCDGKHFSTSKTCPEFERQTRVKLYMAQNCVSYSESIKLHPPVTKTMRDVLTSFPSSSFSSQPQPTTSQQPSQGSHSHKKTVFLKPRSPPKTSKGYDRAAHQSLTAHYDAPSPTNGCALQSSLPENETNILQLITALIKALSPSVSHDSEPSNVASILSFINSIYKRGQSGTDCSVELPKYR